MSMSEMGDILPLVVILYKLVLLIPCWQVAVTLAVFCCRFEDEHGAQLGSLSVHDPCRNRRVRMIYVVSVADPFPWPPFIHIH
jgi:hypothetical protein